MNKKLFDFQEDAINELQVALKDLWNITDAIPKILLKAPTGSGKTLITSAFIDSLQTESPFLPYLGDIAFIWITFGEKLAYQSKDKFYNSFFPNLRNTLSTPEDCLNVLRSNEILFINWEKLSQAKSIDRLKLRRPENVLDRKESGFYFEDIIENTHHQGREIILIIDESHSHVETDNSQDIIKIISPRLIYNMSATPFKNEDAKKAFAVMMMEKKAAKIEIDRQRVIDAGLIKQEIKCQTEEDLKRFKGANIDEVMLDLAIEKRNQIKAEWEKIGLNINPLCLIQLPNDDSIYDDQKTTKEVFTKDYLLRRGVPENRIGVWLDNKPFKEDWRLTDNDSEIDFLLFKLAAGTGWDCPRAHVLVMFREVKSPVFQSQTLGRIVRMACFDDKLLENHPMLKTGYLYTTYERNTVAIEETSSGNNKQKVYSSKLITNSKKEAVVKTYENDLFTLLSQPESIADKIDGALDNGEIAPTETSLPDYDIDKVKKVVEVTKSIIHKKLDNMIAAEPERDLFTVDSTKKNNDETATEVDISQNKIDSIIQETNTEVMKVLQSELKINNYSPLLKQEINEIIQDAVETTAGKKESELILLDPILKSDFLSRTDYGDLGRSSDFQKPFNKFMHEYFGTNGNNSYGDDDKACLEKLNVDLTPTLTKKMMVNEIFKAEEEYDTKKDVQSIDMNVSDNDASHYFTLMCMACIQESSVGNVKRSWSPLRNALIRWVNELVLPNPIKIEDWYRIIVKDFNKDTNSSIKKAILNAIENYMPILKQFLDEKQKEAEENRAKPFRIKTEYNYTSDYEEYTPSSKSLVQPFYLLKDYNGRENETRFIKHLEDNIDVKNWFKNGSHGKDSFCIKYFKTDEQVFDGFYPDWIVLYKNGDIGIFDTKKGNTGVKESQTTRDKAKALQEKIDWLNHNSKLHYIGGILELDSAEWKNTSINLFNSKEN